MDLASAASRLVDSIVEMPSHFAEVAAHDPLSAVLLVLGTVFTGVAVAVLGYLALGAFVSLFTGELSPASPPEGR